MFLRFLLYLLGVVITSIGFMFVLIYSSVFGKDISFISSWGYFFTRLEIYLLPIGLFLIVISLFFDYRWHRINRLLKRKRKNAKINYKEFIKNDK